MHVRWPINNLQKIFKKERLSTLLSGNPLQRQGASPAIWDHLPPDSSQACRLVLDLPSPDGWKSELTWVVCYILLYYCVICLTQLMFFFLLPLVPPVARLYR